MSEDRLRKELSAAFKNRAILYYLIFDELRQEIGQERAVAVMKRAIYRRGEQIGQRYCQFAPGNFDGLKDEFLQAVPDEGRLFDPKVMRCESETLDIHLEACPLKEAWEDLGLHEVDIALMCEIAGEIDKGTFEAAGFSFEPNTWQPGRHGCCQLQIRRGTRDD